MYYLLHAALNVFQITHISRVGGVVLVRQRYLVDRLKIHSS